MAVKKDSKFISSRLRSLPEYPFLHINKLKRDRINKKLPIHDLGIGAPDFPTSEDIIKEFTSHLRDVKNQVYSGVTGNTIFKDSIIKFYQFRFKRRSSSCAACICFSG
jgi:aspartate/methionine/tyrosine aminotransferase